eukprot:2443416-Rhodomonas_salina.2
MPVPAVAVVGAGAAGAAAAGAGGLGAGVVGWFQGINIPLMAAGLVFNYAASINSMKRASALIFQVGSYRFGLHHRSVLLNVAFLFVQLVTGQASGCGMCSELIERMMFLTGIDETVELSAKIDCGSICPFRIRKCMQM